MPRITRPRNRPIQRDPRDPQPDSNGVDNTNPLNQNPEATNSSNKVCRWCNRPGHVRRTHRDCLMRSTRVSSTVPESESIENNDINLNDNYDTQNNINNSSDDVSTNAPAIICPLCGREGHIRRSHFNCALNTAFANLNENDINGDVNENRSSSNISGRTRNNRDRNTAREPMQTEVPRNDIGEMDSVCTSCGAFMWISERKCRSSKINAKFQICCASGRVIIKPIRPVPNVIAELLRNNNSDSIEFKNNIRTYNSALSFTSMNADLDQNFTNSRGGAYAFRIHGSVHHLISGNLTPESNTTQRTPKFAQIYIFDSENELRNRMNVAGNSNVNETTMSILQQMMHDVNPFVHLFKTMQELSAEQPGGIRDIRMIFRSEGSPDPRRYNSPTASEIGVLIVGGEDPESSTEPRNRDIVLRLKGPENQLSRIKEIHQHFDPLQYVLMFPFGDSGWHCTLRSYDPTEMEDVISPSNENINESSEGEISMMQYYSSRLMIRQGNEIDLPKNKQVSLHSFGKLFHQYVVDMYAKMEQQRLNFIRFNQDTLRAAVYNGLRDAVRPEDSDMSAIGKRVILPSTFVGGPRFMAQLYQDAMSLVRRFGKPDLFITFTCNPAWPEITRELLNDQPASDRPDLCARVFNLKLKAMMDDIIKKSVLGKVVAYVYSIEFQKRGLPHCHMLIILDEQDKPHGPEDIDKIVSAEIPDPIAHPLAHKTVTTSMIHGPCGLLNPGSPCMKNGKCTKNYPFDFNPLTEITETGNSSKLQYRRRIMNDRNVMRGSGRITVDNRWVVPHNLFLAAKYDAHINVEICTQINSIKYVYKYIYKGHDRAQVFMGSNEEERQDEIQTFLDARYVSAAEACWRLFSFPMHKEYPASQRLDIHLEDDRRVYFEESDHPSRVINRDPPETTLTAWFNYNLNNPNDIQAKSILYPDFCEKYTFHKTDTPRVWSIRKNGFGGIIGRIYTVSPRDTQKFYLRMLLYKIPGATCFADMRTYNGQLYPSYQATARAMGLLTDDTEWSATLTEACLNQTPKLLRRLFCILIVFSEMSDPFQLWLNFREKLAEDYLYTKQQEARDRNEPVPTSLTDEMFGYCLLDMNKILFDHRFDLKKMDGFKDVFPSQDNRANAASERNSYERMHESLNRESLRSTNPDDLSFNESQKLVYETIRDSALNNSDDENRPNIFFIDGPGGTGKTFLFNALLDVVRRSDHIAIAVASSGTASLLLKGGRTAHSTFSIPLDVSRTSMCDLTPRCMVSRFIEKSRLIVWDECSMISKDLIETVDRSFRDILKNDLPFGGRLVVFGGDFRQVLPVIPKASRSVIVGQCLNQAYFWPAVKKMKLQINMRVQQALTSNNENLATELQQFADFLLNVGEGKVPTMTLSGFVPTDFIRIPEAMHLRGDNLLNLLREVYPNLCDSNSSSDYFATKAILTATNKDVTVINNLLLDSAPGRKITLYSYDNLYSNCNRMQVPTEFLNSIESGSLPPHELHLKVGCPIMAIRNLDPASGVCNGTRMIVRSISRNIIEAKISTGPKVGRIVYIPKIKFICFATEGKSPHDFYRTQFPLRLAFAMTINKSQGQTLDSIGLYLPCHVFNHGQLYVALSRVRTPSSVKIMIDPKISTLHNKEGHYTHNIVYKEVFRN